MGVFYMFFLRDICIRFVLTLLLPTPTDMETVPGEKDLESITGAQMVKPVPLPEDQAMRDISGLPLFDKLVPFAIQQASEEYDVKKSKRTHELSLKIKEMLGLANKYVLCFAF